MFQVKQGEPLIASDSETTAERSVARLRPSLSKGILRFFRRCASFAYWSIVRITPKAKVLYETRYTQTPVTLSMWFLQKVIGFNRGAYWPVHFTSIVAGYQNVYAGVETSPGYSPGCYIQAKSKIYIGDYTQIAPNVGIISANHELHDNRKHIHGRPIRIGKYCWIGMNAVILPEVELGDYTIVGAGSVVTKSFAAGYCVVAGNPARVVKELDKAQCVEHISKFEYNGYIPKPKFESFRKKNLDV